MNDRGRSVSAALRCLLDALHGRARLAAWVMPDGRIAVSLTTDTDDDARTIAGELGVDLKSMLADGSWRVTGASHSKRAALSVAGPYHLGMPAIERHDLAVACAAVARAAIPEDERDTIRMSPRSMSELIAEGG